MPQGHHLRNQDELNHFCALIGQMWLAGKTNIRVEFVDGTGTRTPTQNASLHLWLTMLAEALNDAGYDMRTFPWKQGAEVPWTQHSCKENLWKPIQAAMLGKESTTECNKLEYSEIQDALTRHLANILPGFVPPPWPTRDSA